MSYISIILPAFHVNTKDINQIKNICSIQFDTSIDNINIIQFNDNTNNINYGIKFLQSSLNLSSIEELIFKKNCLQILSEKSFESLKAMYKKINELEYQLNSYKNNNNDTEKELRNDNIKLKNLLISHIEYSDNFRINTEKTLKKIKEEFKVMVLDLEKIRKKKGMDDMANGVGKKFINNYLGNSSLCLINSSINNYFCENNNLSNINGNSYNIIQSSIGNNSSKRKNINSK